MKKTLTLISLLTVTLTTSLAAQTTPSMDNDSEFFLDGASPKTIKKARGIEDKVMKAWSEIQKSVAKEASRYKIRTSVDYDVDLAGINARTYYTYEVAPTLRDGEQVRRDVWAVELSNDSFLSVGTHLRVTFSRNFSGPGAKSRAMTALPYTFAKIPRNSNQIKEKLANGDSVRIEVFGRLGVQTENDITATLNKNVKASYGREALFLIDIYKHSETVVRARILGLKNQGVLKLGASIDTLPSGFSILPRKLREIFSIGLGVEVSRTAAVKQDYPITTLMIDFLYNFSTDKVIPKKTDTSTVAEGAIDEILKDMRRLGFAPLFDPTQKSKSIASSLLAHAKLSESLWNEDRRALEEGRIKNSEVRVKTLFKGSVELDSFTMKGKANGSALISKEGEIGGLKSFITSMDYNDKASYYLLDNSFTHSKTKSKILLGRNDKAAYRDIDLLVESNAKAEPLKIVDLIVKTEIEDKSMNAEQLESIKNTITRALPKTLTSKEEIENFFPSKDETNATLTYQYNFGAKAFLAVGKKNSIELAQKLYNFIEDHPDKRSMALPAYFPESGPSHAEYIESLGFQLNEMLTTPKHEDRMKLFNTLKSNTIVQKFILGEFFSSLLPEETAKDLMGLKLTYSSNETPTKVKKAGDYEISPVYQEVSFIRSIINDRSYDIRMETTVNIKGQEIMKPVQFNGFAK
jgi:hypothetical protein